MIALISGLQQKQEPKSRGIEMEQVGEHHLSPGD
jgi:hypothetical protein